MNETTPRIIGMFEWYDSKSIHIQARFDKVALNEKRLVFISLVGFSQDIKALRAAFATGLDSPIYLKNVELERDGETITPGDVLPVLGGYRLETHRLGFGSIHALFTSRRPGFLRNDSDDTLWQELTRERFTTPLLRTWLPYIRKELELKSLLTRCHTFDCTCCVLAATSADLDSIVEFGLQNDILQIDQGAQSR